MELMVSQSQALGIDIEPGHQRQIFQKTVNAIHLLTRHRETGTDLGRHRLQTTEALKAAGDDGQRRAELMGEINHELLLLLQRLLLRTEVSEADQQKGRPHQLDRLPLHPLNGAEASIGTAQSVAALIRTCRQGDPGIQQGGRWLGSRLTRERQQIRQLSVHHRNGNPLQQQSCRGLIGPVNAAISIDDQHRIGGRIKRHLQHSQ